MKEGEYGDCILYTWIKIENETCWNCSKKGEERIRENNDGGGNLIKI
jgi:hypothetical protein